MEEKQTKSLAVEAYEFIKLMNDVTFNPNQSLTLKNNKFPYSTDQLEKVLRYWGMWDLIKVWADECKQLMPFYEESDKSESIIWRKIRIFFLTLPANLIECCLQGCMRGKMNFMIQLQKTIEAAEMKDFSLEIKKDSEGWGKVKEGSLLDEAETAIKDGEETPTFAKMPSLLKSKHKAFARGNRRKSLKFKTKKVIAENIGE